MLLHWGQWNFLLFLIIEKAEILIIPPLIFEKLREYLRIYLFLILKLIIKLLKVKRYQRSFCLHLGVGSLIHFLNSRVNFLEERKWKSFCKLYSCAELWNAVSHSLSAGHIEVLGVRKSLKERDSNVCIPQKLFLSWAADLFHFYTFDHGGHSKQ